MKKLTIALLVASALTGCASFPDKYDKPLKTNDIAKEKRDEWASTPAVTFVQSSAGIAVRKYNEIPKEVREKKVALSFTGGTTVNVGDLLFALNAQGFRLVSRLTDDTMKKAYTVRSFEGNFGDVLDDMSTTYNVALEYRNGTVYVVESNRYSASLPKNKDFLEAAVKSLKEMGAIEPRSDMMSGMVYYNAKPESAEYIEDYLKAISKNAAMVSLQVAVLTVTMNRETNIGFNWTKFAAVRGNGQLGQKQMASLFNGTSTGTSTGTGTVSSGTSTSSGNTSTSNGSTSSSTSTTNGGTSTSTDTSTTGSATTGAVDSAVASLVTGAAAGFTGTSGFGASFANKAFSLTAALDALSTYGDARTEQNVIMSTISGLTVKINSGDEIPYTKSIGSSTASGGSTTGSAQTETVKSGLELEVTPNFDSSDGTLTSQVKVKMSTLVGFRELSAGQNLGNLSQPQMKDLGFENFGRLAAGETFVVGGITYDQLSNNYTSFPGMEKTPVGSKATKIDRNAIYIVVRPTVTIYTPHANELNAKMRALEAQEHAAEANDEGAKAPAAQKVEVRS